MRAVLNREAVARLRVDDDSGAYVNADATPSLTVTDAAGDTITPGSVSASGTGRYEAVIPAQDALTRLTVNWSYAVSGESRATAETINVVERRIVPLWRYREDAELDELTAEQMLRLADIVEDWFVSALQYPPVREHASVTFRPARNSDRLYVPGCPFPKAVLSVTVGDTALTDTELANLEIDGGGIYRPGGWRTEQLVTVELEHGGPAGAFGAGVPEDVVRAAVILGRYANRGNNYPERARQVATEGALVTFSTPAPDRPTGLPEVDSVVTRYRLPVVV
jgi:hypothetical protein